MNWFLFAISGYFLNAVASVVDKFLLAQPATTKPKVYAFYAGLLSIFALVLVPFGLNWPGLSLFLISLLAGVFSFFGLLYLFEALDIGSASRVLPAIGGLTPILILFLSFVFLGERLDMLQIFAFLLLVFGGMLISFKREPKERQKKRTIFIALAILLTAISLVLIKYVFLHQDFINGFVWTRMGMVLGALFFLISSNLRRSILDAGRQSKGGLSLLFIFNKAIAGAGSIGINLAIFLASVSIVSALQGAQYAFLLIFTIILSKKFPRIIHEKVTRGIIFQKILAIISIAAGLVILSV